jgi:hypothetical protein
VILYLSGMTLVLLATLWGASNVAVAYLLSRRSRRAG